jgi:hypothetical protein
MSGSPARACMLLSGWGWGGVLPAPQLIMHVFSFEEYAMLHPGIRKASCISLCKR